jgi:hypothetical protein
MGSNIFCPSDYVEFIEENSQGEKTSVNRFCGGDDPAIYVSTKSKLQIHYIQTQNFPGTGWVLNFMGVHEGKNMK